MGNWKESVKKTEWNLFAREVNFIFIQTMSQHLWNFLKNRKFIQPKINFDFTHFSHNRWTDPV